MVTKFHLALPCRSIQKTQSFYKDVLGATIGRSAVKWADINLFDNQITFTESGPFNFDCNSYNFNGDVLPSFHFGVILDPQTWENILERLQDQGTPIASKVRFLENKNGEHQSFFIKDPNDYVVEFKCFTNASEVFQP